MERFRITIDGESLVIGVPEPGVLGVAITACVRTSDAGEILEDSCSMGLTGLDDSTRAYFTWPRLELLAGDRIEIEVLAEGPSDEPESTSSIAEMLEQGPGDDDESEDEEEEDGQDDLEQERRDVRRAAEVLGWTLAGDDAPPKAPGPPVATGLETDGMGRFRVTFRDQCHVLGVPGPGVLSVLLRSVVRQHAGPGRDHECEMDLGGLHSRDIHVNWPKYNLAVGDLVVVEILPEGRFDEPTRTRTRTWDQIGADFYEQRHDEIRQRAQALGWTVTEGPAPDPP